ncbi:MAG: hypothetical protein JXR58_07945 [Bacteroidales bacterium]|nr:hypothetical protein [Bacteroidales bacterium]
MDNKFDIFISCTSENKPEVANWVNSFSILIKDLTDRILKRQTKILTSMNLLSDNAFAATAPVEIFSKTSVFIIVIDESYSSSTQSVQELATILSAINKDLSGTKSEQRIIKLLISDVRKANQPELIRNLLPYRFFVKNETEICPVNFNNNKGFTELREFRLRLIDMAYNIASTILQSGNKLTKTVFLAETGTDQIFNREIIKRELIHYGYKVLPDNQLPDDKNLLEKYILECLNFSDLAIHIYGSLEGSIIQSINTNIVDFQNNLSAKYFEESKGKIKRLIWIPPDLLFEEEAQRINIERLKRSSSELLGAELVQTPIEEFKSIMHRTLKETKSNTINQSNYSKNISTYLIFEPKDKQFAAGISNTLEKSGISACLLDEKLENHYLIANHRQNLINCDGVVIISDNPSGQWTKSKMNDVLKSLGFGRKKIYKAKALITKIHIDNIPINNDYLIINGNNSNNEEMIKPLIEKLMN